MSKDSEDLRARLKKSREARTAMLARFGSVPMSILRPMQDRALSERMFIYQHETPDRLANNQPRRAEKQKRLAEAGYKSSGSPSGREIGRGTLAASIMPAHLVAFFIKYYAAPGQVYLDPFMGQGVRMQVAHALKLDYYGYDASEEFFNYIESIRPLIDDQTTQIKTYLGDSRTPDQIPDQIGDFSFHSPPYWDLEDYGDEDAQLGKQSYPDFIDSMHDIARAWLPKFKSGAWHIVNVGDFRKNGQFYSYHSDTIDAFKRAGWVHHDTWILDQVVSGMAKAFAVSFNLKRMAPRSHEYALVFKAP